MKTRQILNQLSDYLPHVKMIEIELNLYCKGSIVMILCLADIIREYKDSPENERIVSHLLAHLCRNHFKEIEYPAIIDSNNKK